MYNQPARLGNGRGKAKLAFAAGAVILVAVSGLAVASADTQSGFTMDANGCGAVTGASAGLHVMNASATCSNATPATPVAATTPAAAPVPAPAAPPVTTAPVATNTQQNVATQLPANPTTMAVAPAQVVTTAVTMAAVPVAAPAPAAAAQAAPAPVTALSRNWSGYEAQSQTGFANASGTWTEPVGSCANPATGVVGYWVGLDGFGPAAKGVEQTGTAFSCANGMATEYAWYEFFPAPPVYLPMATYPVAGGDVVNASIDDNNGLFSLTLADISPTHAAWSFTTSANVNAAASSAEWVIETPGSANGVNATLPNFGNVTFSNCTATLNGVATPVSALTPERLLLTPDGAQTQTAVSGLDTTGSSFNVAFTQ